MSEPVHTLSPCADCGRGYRLRDMYEDEYQFLCTACHRRLCENMNEAPEEEG